MVVAGAGGHALEVADILIEDGFNSDDIFFFNDTTVKSKESLKRFPILDNATEASKTLMRDRKFCLGVGNPSVRKILHDKMISIGGEYKGLISSRARISTFFSRLNEFDVFPFSLISAEAKIGSGVLLNAGAKIHHEVSIGEFTEIGPSSTILGKVTIGKFCQIGSSVTVLPNVNLGDFVIVGAGSVVTKDIPDHSVVVGVPGKIVRRKIHGLL